MKTLQCLILLQDIHATGK